VADKRNGSRNIYQVEDESGVTALFTAAQDGKRGIVQMLIDCGADVDCGKPETGLTPLCGAAANGHTDVIQVRRWAMT
jgi:ankyrin repeat protein